MRYKICWSSPLQFSFKVYIMLLLRMKVRLIESYQALAEYGITSLQALRKQEPSRIEMVRCFLTYYYANGWTSSCQLLGRRTPFGHEVLAFLQSLPPYNLSIEVDDISSYNGKKPVSVTLTISCSLADALVIPSKSKHRTKFPGMTSILTATSDLDFIDFRRIALVHQCSEALSSLTVLY